jgi:anti-anti-sigma factor
LANYPSLGGYERPHAGLRCIREDRRTKALYAQRTVLKPQAATFSHLTRRSEDLLALAEEARLDGSVALRVHGTVDDETVEEFESTLDSAMGAEPGRLVLDLSDCRLDSAGLAALVRVQRRFRDRRSVTRLVATDVDLLRLLQIVGLMSGFRVFASLDAALHSYRLAGMPATVGAAVGGGGDE